MWDAWTAMVATALASAVYWASWQQDGSSDAADGSSRRGDSGNARQRTQKECMQQAAFQLSPAAQHLLLRSATAGLHGLERGQTRYLLYGLAGHCRIDPAHLERHVLHHMLVRAIACLQSDGAVPVQPQLSIMRCGLSMSAWAHGWPACMGLEGSP